MSHQRFAKWIRRGPVEHMTTGDKDARHIDSDASETELLLWKRVEGKGLYELYRENTGGSYFVRMSNGIGEKTWALEPSRAEAIIATAKRKRITDVPNESLRNGYVGTRNGRVYNTRLDEVVFVGVGSEADTAAIYRTRDGELYLHLIERDVDEIVTGFEDVSAIEALVDCWFNQSFFTYLLWIEPLVTERKEP